MSATVQPPSGVAAPPQRHAVREHLNPLRPLLVAWGLFVSVEAAIQPYRAVRNYDSTDWFAFATGGRLVHDGAGAALYTLGAQLQAQTAVLGHPPARLAIYPNLPLFAWLIQPIAVLPLRTSTAIWSGLLLACLVAGVLLLATLLPREWSAGRRLGIAVATGALLPVGDAVGFGQLTTLALPALALALRRTARHGDGVAIGLLLAAVAVKPQNVWVVVPILAVLGMWRALAGMTLGGAVWIATGVWIAGIDGMVRWVRDFLPNGYISETSLGSSIPNALAAAGLPARVAFVIGAPLALAVVALMWRHRAAFRAEPALAIALGVALSALFSPHAFDRDLALGGCVLVLVATRRPLVATLLGIATGLGFLLDEAGRTALGLHWVTVAMAAAVVLGITEVLARRDATRVRAAGTGSAPATAPGQAARSRNRRWSRVSSVISGWNESATRPS